MLSLTSEIKTPFHGLPAGLKLAALSVATVGLFALEAPALLGLAAICVLCLYLICGTAFARKGLHQLRPLWLVLVLIFVWHAATGEWQRGAGISLRLATAVALANLVTLTTRLSEMIDVLMWFLAPMRRIGINTAPLALSIALVVRFVPVLSERARSLSLAWRARAPKSASWRIVLPLTVSAIDDAEHVAEALRARGGVAGEYSS